jgi:hypothetical protein
MAQKLKTPTAEQRKLVESMAAVGIHLPGVPCPTSGLSSPFVHFVAIIGYPGRLAPNWHQSAGTGWDKPVRTT